MASKILSLARTAMEQLDEEKSLTQKKGKGRVFTIFDKGGIQRRCVAEFD